MDNELRQKIQQLEARVEALAGERLPSVDRASRRRDRRQVMSGLGLFAVAILLAGTMSASALTGTDTVDSGDIVDGTITSADIKSDSILGSRVRDNTLTGADINESSIPGFRQIHTAAVGSDGVPFSGDSTYHSHANTGIYTIGFPGTYNTQCVATASVRTQYTPTGTATVDSSGGTSITVRVTAGGTNADRPFYVIVVCP